MDIATAKTEVTTRTGLPHTNAPTPLTQPYTSQHDIKSLAHRKEVDGSMLIRYIQGNLMQYQISPPLPGFKPRLQQ